MKHETLVALDIETSNGRGSGSLEPRDEGSVIALVQLAFEDGTIEVYDWNSETESYLEGLIDDGHRFVCHNASFELDWFGTKSRLKFPKVWCTQVASQVLNAGRKTVDEATAISGRVEGKDTSYLGVYDPLFEEKDENIVPTKKTATRFSHSYQATAYRYAGAVVTKDEGNSDWLQRPLSPSQLRYAKDDVRYLIEIARKQWEFGVGLGLDKVLLLEMKLLNVLSTMKIRGIKIDKDGWRESAAEHKALADELEEKLNYAYGLELAQREERPSLFGTYIPKAFKVSSPTQLARFYGVDNADESTLKSIEHPLIHDTLEFKQHNKIASTYGDSYLKFIRQDGRIHSSLIQAETATGRLSSRNPNLQVIQPEMLKSMFSTDEGMILMYADYSAVESRILAYVSGDENFIQVVNSTDIHSENARKIFNIPADSPVDPELRRKAKVLSFSIPYGVSAVGLYNRGLTTSLDEAQELMDDFFAQYPKVYRFLKNSVAEALTKGYTQNPFGRIRWYEIPKRATDEEIRQATAMASRQAQNHGIQSLSADATKRALVNIHEYLMDTGYGYLILTVHDSIISELHMETAGEAASTIKRLMEEAGPLVYPSLITPVDVDMGHKVKRTCVISGLKFSTFTHLLEGNQVIDNKNFIEPRVKSLIKDYKLEADFSVNEKLKKIISGYSDEWKAANKDLVKAFA